MTFMFRALGIVLMFVTGWTAYAAVSTISLVPGESLLDDFARILLALERPSVWLIIALICFGIAQIAARQERIAAEIAAAKQRARAKANQPPARPVNFAPPDAANRPPRLPSPNDVRDSRYQNVYVRRAPGRDVAMRIPPDNPARDWQEIPEPRGRFRWSKYPEPRPNPRDPKLEAIEAPQPRTPPPPIAR